MKRLIYIALTITALSSISCKKILEPETPSYFTQDYVFGNITDANKAVNSVYAMFNADAYTSRVSTNYAGNTDVEVGGVASAPDGGRRDIWSFEATSGNSELLAVWNNAYSAINRANDCIEGLQASSMANDKSFKQLVGECKALRAYWYYLLVNNWGDVPFNTKATKAGDNFYQGKTGRDTILTYLINDLIAAEPDMSWADQLDFGTERINREFVQGFIARLALMRGGYWLYPDMTMRRKDDYRTYYDIANKYCKQLIATKPHSLSPFATVFDNINRSVKVTDDDVLWEVAFAPGAGDVGWNIGVTVAAGTHNYGSTSIAMLLTPNYYYSFDTTDLRLPVTCSLVQYDKDLNQLPVAVTSITMNKWNRLLRTGNLGPSTSKGTGVNWPVMRYTDVLLMLAETENEIAGGPTAAAKDALRIVRQRAFPTSLWGTKVESYINSLATKDDFFTAIVNERAWEFGGEFLRKYDLARWNLYGKKVAETINTLTQMGADAKSGSGTYSNLPDILYYTKNGSTINFLNKYTKLTNPAAVVPAGTTYYQTNWLVSLYSTTNNGPADYILRQYRGYTDLTGNTPVRYLVPIHSSVIANSLGSLDNNGYGFK
jgi:starch-binding outer membrane protein, SusD/RagB family